MNQAIFLIISKFFSLSYNRYVPLDCCCFSVGSTMNNQIILRKAELVDVLFLLEQSLLCGPQTTKHVSNNILAAVVSLCPFMCLFFVENFRTDRIVTILYRQPKNFCNFSSMNWFNGLISHHLRSLAQARMTHESRKIQRPAAK